MKIVLFFVRRILSLRYKVVITGEKELSHDGPLLILPNHVALVDPRIIISFLGKYIPISPVASEKYYNKPGMKQIMDLVGTVPIGEMSAGAKKEDVEKVFSKIVEELGNGKNILIYPSGQIYRQGFEVIKGKQAVYNIAKLMPENTKVVGIKDRGLWGSIWSMAWDNGKTGFGGLYLQSIGYVFANLIFFVPKRTVTLEIQDITSDIHDYKNKSLNEFNTFLEDFYNTSGEEGINYIPHYFYYNDVKNRKEPAMIDGSLAELNSGATHDLSSVDEEIKNTIKNKVATIKEIKPETVLEDSNLVINLFFDSLDLAEIKSYIQANFTGASNPPIGDLKTIGDLIIMAIGKSANVEEMKECEWGEGYDNGDLINALNNKDITSISHLWKQNFKNSKKTNFLWDNILGMQSRRDFILKAYFIAGRLKKIEGDYIGIMMPAVGGASLLIMATYLAGKIPVMFNWTLPTDAFKHCVNFSKVEKIVSVSSFYDRVKSPVLDEYNNEGKFIFLEDLLKDGKIIEKVGALVKSLYLPLSPAKGKYPKEDGGNNIAVILFTSGSESLPKAVPLTHTNLIENIKGAIEVFKVKQDDVLLGFLPPFHSFGFTVNTIMPLISGVRVAHTPDPNDAQTILNVIKNTRITALTATPTFLKMIMSLASGDDLHSLRYAVVGAEKCPQAVFDRFSELCPQGKILEGYGITECSPVVSINPVDSAKPGTVGKVIQCLDCKIISVDSGEQCNAGEQGMIYVRGQSIFSGYLDKTIESPFEEINGEDYYKTGDLGFLDEDGFLSITGRLKRFIKIAGEMISLPFVEGVIAEKYNSGDELQIAIEALEKDGEAKIVLFSISKISVDEVNDYMRKNGVPNLVKISENIVVDEIPVLGTGKTDYKELKKLIVFA